MTFICNTMDDAFGMAWAVDPDNMMAVFRRIMALNATHGKGWAVHRQQRDQHYFERRRNDWLEDHNQALAHVDG